MIDIDIDVLFIDSRCIDVRLLEYKGFINSLSDGEFKKWYFWYFRIVYGKLLKLIDLIYFVFVYVNEDYYKFRVFSEWFKEIKSIIKNGYIVKCDDCESEMFLRNYDDNINEICERVIFILLFFFKYFCDNKVFWFFISEVIGMIRLD